MMFGAVVPGGTYCLGSIIIVVVVIQEAILCLGTYMGSNRHGRYLITKSTTPNNVPREFLSKQIEIFTHTTP